ncbi:MAG: Bacterial leucyl aminopeptidase [Phycisphaerae bacterium]|nr:Bacterial leucyl aminopeptidase [Phycisphaerae bacterium]
MRLLCYPRTWRGWIILGAVVLGVAGLLVGAFLYFTWMPGRSYGGPLPALTASQTLTRDRLKADVAHLAGDIGDRNLWRPDKMSEAASWIETRFLAAGYTPRRQEFPVNLPECRYGALKDVTACNVEAELTGGRLKDEILIVGAHYDTRQRSEQSNPGADDNASGIAGTIELARLLRGRQVSRTIRFVAWANEEWPFFATDNMGSYAYAKRCRQRGEKVVGMISLEMIGCFSDAPGSQHYPFPFALRYPSTADFIGFVGNHGSRRFIRDAIRSFRQHAQFPSQGGAPPIFLAPDITRSDQWGFWEMGYPGFMLTDTSNFRSRRYHTSADTPDTLDYGRMARVVTGMADVLADLAGRE